MRNYNEAQILLTVSILCSTDGWIRNVSDLKKKAGHSRYRCVAYYRAHSHPAIYVLVYDIMYRNEMWNLKSHPKHAESLRARQMVESIKWLRVWDWPCRPVACRKYQYTTSRLIWRRSLRSLCIALGGKYCRTTRLDHQRQPSLHCISAASRQKSHNWQPPLIHRCLHINYEFNYTN